MLFIARKLAVGFERLLINHDRRSCNFDETFSEPGRFQLLAVIGGCLRQSLPRQIPAIRKAVRDFGGESTGNVIG